MEEGSSVKPVKQNRVAPLQGNCASACLASIFEIPIEEVFDGEPGEEGAVQRKELGFWHGLKDWLMARGLMYAAIQHAPYGYSIAIGPSPRLKIQGSDKPEPHACIALDGNLIHDPHPDNTFFGGKNAWEYWVLYLLDAGGYRGRTESGSSRH